MVPYLSARLGALEQCLQDAPQGGISEKVKTFWTQKKVGTETLLDVFKDASKERGQLDPQALEKREEYLKAAKDTWEVSLKSTIEKLNKEVIGPFTLGGSIFACRTCGF
jgi:rubrerythrin